MATFDKYDDTIDSRDSDGERLHACIMLAETDCTEFEDETETGEQDNG